MLPRFTSLVLLFISYSALAQTRAIEIIRRGEETIRGETQQALMTMQIRRASYTRTLKLRAWTAGGDHALVEILEPTKEEGVSSLRRRDQMWNYLPKVDQVVRIPTSLMLQSWMGSDFTNDDLMRASSLVRDYHHRFLKKGALRGTILIECLPKPGAPVVWGRVLYWARLKDSLPVKQAYYDENGVLVRTVFFKRFKKMDDRVIPTEITMRPAGSSESTTVRYAKVLYDRKLGVDIFDRDRLRENAQHGTRLHRGWITKPMRRRVYAGNP